MQLQDVSFRYKSADILNNVTLSIPSGQMVGIIGENGSGKSTLLKLMAGLLVPTTGTITLEGEQVTRRLANKIAYQPDIDLFYENYTGEQVFQFYAEQFDDFSIDKAHVIASHLQVPTTEKLKKLSKGNRGRVKMAATLGRETPLYILDEPFAGLDPLAREALIKGLIRFVDLETQSIILSTHEVNEVEPVLDQLILLQNGQVRAMEELELIRDERGEDAVQWMKSLYEKQVD
ncbi:ABC transporter ATP-binding protein [Lysinibacillus sp. KU-BSD001]|uniref:ATP-binding cassette domain-containing protein n=1 Tax=Lysinibacillus sp. KU-BSD001 TaxID=3141328 RepID=UPI0036EFCA9C